MELFVMIEFGTAALLLVAAAILDVMRIAKERDVSTERLLHIYSDNVVFNQYLRFLKTL